MCGRYALQGPRTLSRADREYFAGLDDFPASYNVAPTATMPIAHLVAGQPRLTPARWGLVPYWSRDAKGAAKAINARAETCTATPYFRDAYREMRRCLVPASGFYEWKKTAAGTQPYYFTSTDGALLAFAGLWERWRTPEGAHLVTYTVITTAANALVAPVHNRMPVILAPEEYAQWLTLEDARELMRPCALEMLMAYPVSARVNRPQANDAELVQPADTVKRSGHDC